MTEKIRFALHGGAGDLPPEAGPQPEHRKALKAIADETLALLKTGASALDAVELAVVRLEECPLFNAGIGAVLNRDGQPELDAAIMSGADRACGSVAGVSRIKSPVKLARAVMERSPHVMFMGLGAEALGRELGLEAVTPDYFITEERFHQLKDAHKKGVIVLDHDSAFGTVGAVARDAQGRLAAATSTGGLTNKHPGRIGDTPIIGAGTFADDRSAAISCTGTGECFIRSGFCFNVDARMRYSNWDVARACAESLDEIKRQNGRGGCIAVDHAGHLTLPYNSRVMYRAWCDDAAAVQVAIGPD